MNKNQGTPIGNEQELVLRMQGFPASRQSCCQNYFFYVLGTNVLGTGAGLQYYTPQTIMTPQMELYKNLWCLGKSTDTIN